MRFLPICAAALLIVLPAITRAQEPDFNEELMMLELQPEEALILITIADRQNKAMSGVVISVSRNGKPFSTEVSDNEGKVFLIVPTRAVYDITFLSLSGDVFDHAERFEIDERPEQRYSLTMTYTAVVRKEFVLEGVQFNTGTAVLKPVSHKKLSPLIEYMKTKPRIHIELSGHTDNQGDPEANLLLSEERAKAVRAYIVSQGIDEHRIAVTGFGDMKPVADNRTEAGRAKNRRTEVRIIE